jgi:hypothetical protein
VGTLPAAPLVVVEATDVDVETVVEDCIELVVLVALAVVGRLLTPTVVEVLVDVVSSLLWLVVDTEVDVVEDTVLDVAVGVRVYSREILSISSGLTWFETNT